jgi:twitching motility protein PilT
MEITALLGIALQKNASDVHLIVPYPPIIRVDGRLSMLEEFSRVSPEINASIFRAISSERQRQIFDDLLELDFSYEAPGVSRFRVNVSYRRGSISLVFRPIKSIIPTFSELGLPDICKALVQLPRGLILITGPAGSGKSSTLAAMLEYVNQSSQKNIIMIEDPIEFLHQSKKCIISQRELGGDTKSFANSLNHILRQDPDIIMIGEMRDLETMSAAITAAETGHLVLSTLHTRGAAESVSRIIDAFPAVQQPQIKTQLSDALEGVISQVLLRRVDGKGRVAAFEVMIGTTSIKNLIRENRTNQITSFLEIGRREGMRTLDQDLERLLASGIISLEEALAKAKRLNTPQTLVTKI